MTGDSTALSVGRTQHLRERQPCSGMAEIRIRPGEMRMGQTGDCAGQTARGDGENSAREIAHEAVGVRRSGGREGESGWFSGVRWVRESPGRATGFCISRGASRPSCVLVPFSFTQPL